MANTYSLGTILAVAIPLGVACLVVFIVILLIVLKYSKLLARERLIEQRLANGDFRRLSASGLLNPNHSQYEGRHRSWLDRWFSPPIKHTSSNAEKPNNSRSSRGSQRQIVDPGRFQSSPERSRRESRNNHSTERNSRDKSRDQRNSTGLASSALPHDFGPGASKSNISPKRLSATEQLLGSEAQGPIKLNDLEGNAKHRHYNMQQTRNALNIHSRSSSSHDSMFSTRTSRMMRSDPQDGEGHPYSFLIESGLGSAANLAKDMDAGSQLPSPPVPPFRSPARSSRMTDRTQDFNGDSERLTPSNENSSPALLQSYGDLTPPPKSALRPGTPSSRGSFAFSRMLSESSLSPPSVQNLNDGSRNNMFSSTYATPPGFKTPPLPGVSENEPQSQRSRFNIITPGFSQVSTPMVTPQESFSENLASMSRDRIPPIRSTPTSYDRVPDSPLPLLARQNKPRLQQSPWSDPEESPSEILGMALSAYEDRLNSLSNNQTTPFPQINPHRNAMKQGTRSLEPNSGKAESFSPSVLNKDSDQVDFALRTNADLAERLLLETATNLSRERIVGTLQKDENIHEGSERVGRTQIESGHTKVHSLAGSVIAPTSTSMRSRANSTRKNLELQKSKAINQQPPEPPGLPTAPDYEKELGDIDSNSVLFRQWLAATPNHPMPEKKPSQAGGSKSASQQTLLLEKKQPPPPAVPSVPRITTPPGVKAEPPPDDEQNERDTANADKYSIERAKRVSLESVRLRSPLQFSESRASSLSRSSSLASNVLLANLRPHGEGKHTATPVAQGTPKKESNLLSIQPGTKPSTFQVPNSIRKIAALQVPASPRSPGYQPGQQLDSDNEYLDTKAKSSLQRRSHSKRSAKRFSTSSAEIDRSAYAGQIPTGGFKEKTSKTGKSKGKKTILVNKPLPMTPLVLKDGVIANLGGAKFVVTMAYQGNLSDEIDLHCNDIVKVYEIFDDGWCLVRIVESTAHIANRNHRGVCPRSCLAELPSHTTT